ncbi:hypothetical protein L195_g031877 [Trifolium pratense]|uniref:Uncharacterized protein n=1 Tax=Trifolium pratense TaxID=57577 RepID=A0A2K3LBM5_TRIPR|nr:hypothetical protein L195_g031877 [Trifolium pratense]
MDEIKTSTYETHRENTCELTTTTTTTFVSLSSCFTTSLCLLAAVIHLYSILAHNNLSPFVLAIAATLHYLALLSQRHASLINVLLQHYLATTPSPCDVVPNSTVVS